MSVPAAIRERASGPGTAAQHALEALRREMVAGRLRPGDRVRQEEIAAAAGVSIAPVREALATLEQEGQVRYLPRRGYFVAELDLDDLLEIYDLRRLLESRAAREGLPLLDEGALERLETAAGDCVAAAANGDVAAELEANRRFHFAVFEAPGLTHTLRLIRLLWDSTETYRAMYYNAPEGREEAVGAHERILAAVRAGDAEALIAAQDAHRARALELLTRVLAPAS